QLVEVKLNVVTAGKPLAIEHSSPTASSENSTNSPKLPRPFYAQLDLQLRLATLNNSVKVRVLPRAGGEGRSGMADHYDCPSRDPPAAIATTPPLSARYKGEGGKVCSRAPASDWRTHMSC